MSEKENVPVKDIKAIIAEEYKKCAQSPQYFIRKYCHIQHPTKGRLKFDLYDYQHDAINDFESFQYNIILKGRQIGISTVVGCYALWMMLFAKDRNILVLATKQDTAKNLIAKVQYAFELLPVWLQVPCIEKNKLSLKFKNGSGIKAATAAPEATRSEAVSLLVLDEAAFIEKVDKIWTAAVPTISTGGKCIVLSSPNGLGGWFYNTWIKAESGVVDSANEMDILFHPIKLDWRRVPGRTQKWRDSMDTILGKAGARQEHDAEFIGSGNTVIDSEILEFYKTLVKDPIYKRGFDGNIWVWESPNPNKSYFICADVARGDGGDFSAFHIFESEFCRQVAEYKGKISPDDFGDMLVAIGTEYMDALVVVENAQQGYAVLQRMINRQYKNIFYMHQDIRVVDSDAPQSNNLYAQDKKKVPGFTTSLRTRPVIISKLQSYMRDQAVEIYSKRLMNELETFVWENGKAQAMHSCNDDLVMSLAIGLWVRDTALQIFAENNERTKAVLENIQKTGNAEVGLYTPKHLQQDPYKFPMGGPRNLGEDDDLRWLLG